nr:MAG TPA: hypothetical protein [Caudoviricetes sp.]
MPFLHSPSLANPNKRLHKKAAYISALCLYANRYMCEIIASSKEHKTK